MLTARNRPDRAVIFLHIPKTAGSTLHQIIRRQFPARSIYHVGSRPDSQARFQDSPERERAALKVLMGHFDMGIDRYLPQPSTYFTMLRHPVARAISYHAHVRRDREHYCHDLVTSGRMSLAAFIQSGADVMMDNGQTRMLAGVLYAIPYGECGPDVLAAAQHNLETRFSFVGLTEEFDQTLLFMRHHFGWRYLYYRPRNVSVRQDRHQLPHEAMTQIEAANELDLALYAFATALVAEQVAQLEPGFSRQLARFQRLNRFLGPIAHFGDEIRLRLLGPGERK